MYQTVGHQGVELYAEAMGLPLFRQPTQGIALHNEKVYTPTPEDEVEDLYQLLVKVKEEVDIEAVAVGAVLSDYQRIRVENVCSRLGLVALAYLWRRDQGELLQDMIDCNIDAIIIKVATLGLDPYKHLGLKISEIQPHLIKMR
uniref:Diphthine--ammonia ligase n=1 Tax=Clastoptera arizonana TaxID=38151 RepID=A0A1B6C6I9_9HEMI